MRRIDPKLREPDSFAQVNGEYALNGRHVASGNGVGQCGVGEVRQPAHPLGGSDFLRMQATARSAHQVERACVFGAESILELAPNARGEGR
jgi:hypothetical protein